MQSLRRCIQGICTLLGLLRIPAFCLAGCPKAGLRDNMVTNSSFVTVALCKLSAWSAGRFVGLWLFVIEEKRKLRKKKKEKKNKAT